LEPAEPVRRYEREHPGELIHLDIKKLGRIGSIGHRITGRKTGVVNRHLGIGWEYVHVCIDDASRIAFVQVMANQRKESAVAFLEAAIAYYAKLGVRIERVMTDNGSCYRSKRFRTVCKQHGVRQIFTRPYTPKTNGKAERFIQTALREWAYAQAYHNSDQRSAELIHWLHRYNWHRPHGSLNVLKRGLKMSLPVVVRGDGRHIFETAGQQQSNLVLFLHIRFEISKKESAVT
jgi:transposase InsO family protein